MARFEGQAPLGELVDGVVELVTQPASDVRMESGETVCVWRQTGLRARDVTRGGRGGVLGSHGLRLERVGEEARGLSKRLRRSPFRVVSRGVGGVGWAAGPMAPFCPSAALPPFGALVRLRAGPSAFAWILWRTAPVSLPLRSWGGVRRLGLGRLAAAACDDVVTDRVVAGRVRVGSTRGIGGCGVG